MPAYRIAPLPIQVSDSAVRSICEQFGIELTQGPEIGSDWVSVETVEPIDPELIPQIEDAIDEAIRQATGRITRLS